MDCASPENRRTHSSDRRGRTRAKIEEEERETKGDQWKTERESPKQTTPGRRPVTGARNSRGESGAREGGLSRRSLVDFTLTMCFQRRLERIERLKDDPYYIFDKKELEKPIASTSSDIDSIPIVHLDDLMPTTPGAQVSTRVVVLCPLLTLLLCSASTARDYPQGRFPTIPKTGVCG